MAEFARAGVAAVNFGPGDPPQAHTRDESIVGRGARPCATGCCERFAASLEAFARPERPARRIPSCASPTPSASCWPAGSRSSTSASASRARTRRRSSARRWPRRSQPQSTYPLAEGLPELRAAIAGVDRAALRRRRSTPTPRSSRRSAPRRRSSTSPRSSGGDFVAVTDPGYPVAERGARVRRQAGARARRCSPSAASCPTSTRRRRHLGRASAILWLNYPNNPTAATAPLELYERAAGDRARARRRGRLRRGVLGDLLRRGAAGLGARRSPTAAT